MNSATPFCTSSSEYSNSAAMRFDSARRAIFCGLETGASVGNGGGDSHRLASSIGAAGLEASVEEEEEEAEGLEEEEEVEGGYDGDDDEKEEEEEEEERDLGWFEGSEALLLLLDFIAWSWLDGSRFAGRTPDRTVLVSPAPTPKKSLCMCKRPGTSTVLRTEARVAPRPRSLDRNFEHTPLPKQAQQSTLQLGVALQYFGEIEKPSCSTLHYDVAPVARQAEEENPQLGC
ncbi:hypothetical protein B7463_g2278, partial [Scytalidium lignicola]